MRLLFLCTGNSCRSQMAEGWVRSLGGAGLRAASAGLQPKGLDPRAVAVMAEVGVDISGQTSNAISEIDFDAYDVVVTVCGNADAGCPRVPAPVRVVHRGFDDPPQLARDASTEEQALEPYRRVRDEIRRFVEGLPQSLEPPGGV